MGHKIIVLVNFIVHGLNINARKKRFPENKRKNKDIASKGYTCKLLYIY